jgi:hypothetical protein
MDSQVRRGQTILMPRGNISAFIKRYKHLEHGQIFIDSQDDCMYIGSPSPEITYKVPMERIYTTTLVDRNEDYFSEE